MRECRAKPRQLHARHRPDQARPSISGCHNDEPSFLSPCTFSIILAASRTRVYRRRARRASVVHTPRTPALFSFRDLLRFVSGFFTVDMNNFIPFATTRRKNLLTPLSQSAPTTVHESMLGTHISRTSQPHTGHRPAHAPRFEGRSARAEYGPPVRRPHRTSA